MSSLRRLSKSHREIQRDCREPGSSSNFRLLVAIFRIGAISFEFLSVSEGILSCPKRKKG